MWSLLTSMLLDKFSGIPLGVAVISIPLCGLMRYNIVVQAIVRDIGRFVVLTRSVLSGAQDSDNNG